MPTFQLEREERVNITRTYEVEADTEEEAIAAVRNDTAELVDEQVQDTYSADNKSVKVIDIDGMDPAAWRRLHGEERDDADAA